MSRDASGLVGHARGFAASGVRAVRTRLELLSIEIQEEKARIVRDLVIAIAGLCLLLCGIFAAIAWIVVSTPVEQRMIVLGFVTFVFLLAGGGVLLWLYYTSVRRTPLFDATVEVLKRDEQALNEMAP
ncbi:MAG TPA: phage holin family protein [Burkholderiaceae bacterium]|nr:phage holin family protein [Burkholderiaceae bacterium]